MAVTRTSATRRLVALAIFAALFTTLLPAVSAEAATAATIRDSLQMRINNTRESRGLSRLKISWLPCDASAKLTCMRDFTQGHARKMGNRGRIFHDGSKALWNEVPIGTWWRAENVGFVSAGSGEARRMHKAFMRSTGHRANILKPRATHFAIGVYKLNGRVWVVERFADLKPFVN